jgi:hypothetical protein
MEGAGSRAALTSDEDTPCPPGAKGRARPYLPSPPDDAPRPLAQRLGRREGELGMVPSKVLPSLRIIW